MNDRTTIWSAPVAVAQIPETGLHQAIVADAGQRAAIAGLAGLREVAEARASFDLHRAGGDKVHVTGVVSAIVGQTCVVTLEPLANAVEERVDLTFAPEGDPLLAAKAAAGHEGGDPEAAEPPEPIVSGRIDLGALATEYLLLGIDPYPRKPGAVFEPPPAVDDPDDHPFAALKALKRESGSGGKKPKGG